MTVKSDFLELAAKRRTVHKYQKTSLDHEILTNALQSALLAPNHRKTDPWHFVVVGRETRVRLAERVFEIKKLQVPDIAPEQKQAGIDSFVNPAGLVVFAQKRTDNEFQRREDYATLACAIQNFSLYLAEQDLGTKWSTASYTTDDQIYKILEMSEADFEIVGFVWAGKAVTPPAEQHRPFLSDVLRVLP